MYRVKIQCLNVIELIYAFWYRSKAWGNLYYSVLVYFVHYSELLTVNLYVEII